MVASCSLCFPPSAISEPPASLPPGPAPAPTTVTEVSGTKTVQAWFAVNLPSPRGVPAICRVSTRDGTAHAGNDYRPLAPVEITFAPGEIHKWVSIKVTATVEEEWNEVFFLDVEDTETHEVKFAACTIERLSVTALPVTAAGDFQLRFPTGVGQRYYVEESLLPNGEWSTAGSIVNGTGAPLLHSVDAAAGRRFFRVRSFSPPFPVVPAAGT
jgi:hypothetical protein